MPLGDVFRNALDVPSLIAQLKQGGGNVFVFNLGDGGDMGEMPPPPGAAPGGPPPPGAAPGDLEALLAGAGGAPPSPMSPDAETPMETAQEPGEEPGDMGPPGGATPTGPISPISGPVGVAAGPGSSPKSPFGGKSEIKAGPKGGSKGPPPPKKKKPPPFRGEK